MMARLNRMTGRSDPTASSAATSARATSLQYWKIEMTVCRQIMFTLIVSAGPSVLAAEPLTWGQLDIAAGGNRISNIEGHADFIFDRNPTTLDILGRIGADWDAFGAQLDLKYGSQGIPADEYAGYLRGNFAVVRGNYDLSDTLTLGAFYGAGQSTPAQDERADFDFYGVEAAYRAGSFVIGAQLGAFDAAEANGTDSFHSGSFIRISGLYALDQVSAIEAEIGYFDGQQDDAGPPSYPMHATTWAVKYSRQIGSNPMAWSVGLDGGRYAADGTMGDSGSYDELRVTLGLTAWFGDGGLPSAKRRGIFGQPDFARIVTAGNNVD
jgi:hypothetical protein